MPADQPDWGGGGGGWKTTEVPGNQLLLARGSAETIVISGRLLSLVWSLWELVFVRLIAARIEDRGPWLEFR